MKAMKGCPESVLERLADTAPGLEIWWDSSPIVFPVWRQKLLAQIPPAKRSILERQIHRLYNPDEPGHGLFKGVTSNPPLSYHVIQEDPVYWGRWVQTYAVDHPGIKPAEVAWALYREIIYRGAQAFLPIFNQSGFRFGYMSAQVDPRHIDDSSAMIRMATDLASLSPNVIIKIPASRAGITTLEELTAQGISTNVTLAYVIPQFHAAAEAVLRGLQRARCNGVDLTQWRSVITDMSGRWENAPEFTEEAKKLGIDLTPEEIRWASIAIFKYAYRHFREKAYPSKLLLCSMRVGPSVGGAPHIWHLEHTAGSDAVFTFPPPFLNALFTQFDDLEFHPRIWEDIPQEVYHRLSHVPYFCRAVDLYGYTVEEFDSLPSLISTRQEFSTAMDKMEDFVRNQMVVKIPHNK